jgi:hypothetical protein
MPAGDPQFNLAGAYFPAWLVCILGGLFLFWLIHLILLKLELVTHLFPLSLVYAAIISTMTCSLWLFFFSSK